MHAVITGGAQGIGLACAQHLTSNGWSITLIDKDKGLLEQSSSDLGCEYASGRNRPGVSQQVFFINR